MARLQPREIYGVTLNIAQVPARRSTITDLARVDGTLFVAGLSVEEFSSRLRQVSYPFDGAVKETSVEVFHVGHGKNDTQSPIRALTSFDGGQGIPALSVAGQEHLDVPISDEGYSLGVPRENLDHPGVTWMANLDRSANQSIIRGSHSNLRWSESPTNCRRTRWLAALSEKPRDAQARR